MGRIGAGRQWQAVAGLFLAIVLGAAAAPAADAEPSGGLLYEQRCATCHDNPQGEIPIRLILERRSPEAILRTLTTGRMQAMAAGLTEDEKRGIALWLSKRPPGRDPSPTANLCTTPAPPLRAAPGDWSGWGMAPGNSRFQPAPGFTAAEVPRLRLKWAYAVPGGTAVAEPSVVGDWLFMVTGRGVAALDARSGCTRWHVDVPASKLVTVAALPDRPEALRLFLSVKAEIVSLDAASGSELWRARVDSHGAARVTGPVIIRGDTLYAGVSSLEDPMWHDPRYPCCSFRGSVVALDAATGARRWQTHSIAEAPRKLGRVNEAGTELFGPAGGSIYAPLAIDERRGLLYAATAESYHHDGVAGTNAIIAFDLATGARRWVVQPRPADNAAHCANHDEEDACGNPGSALFEFAAAPYLATLPDGRQLLLAGQKSGVLYALDPDRNGALVWQARVSEGGSLGGIQHGMVVIDGRAYLPISDSEVTPPFRPGGLAAVDLQNGRLLYRTQAPPPVCAWGSKDCSAANASAPVGMPGVIFAGGWDGYLRAFRMRDGSQLWSFDAGGSFSALNQAEARGGAIGGYPLIVAHGSLYLVSGAGTTAAEGNALLAFTVDGR